MALPSWKAVGHVIANTWYALAFAWVAAFGVTTLFAMIARLRGVPVAGGFYDVIGLTLLGVLIVPALYVVFNITRKDTERRQQLEKVIAAAEVTPEQSKIDLVTFVSQQVSAMAARENLTMLRAERDANRLTALGIFLTVVSVFAPIAATVLYVELDPLPAATVVRLQELNARIGFVPTGDQLTIARDWHVLAGGLSLGFLFLAAARGVLRLESRNRAAALSLSRRVSHFERLAGILHVNARLSSEPDQLLAQTVRDVMSLAKGAPEIEVPATEADDVPTALQEQLAVVLDLMKKPSHSSTR